MRMVRHVLEGIGGMEIFPIIGLLIFLAFFIGVVVYVLMIKREKIDSYSRIPLQNEDQEDEEDTKEL